MRWSSNAMEIETWIYPNSAVVFCSYLLPSFTYSIPIFQILPPGQALCATQWPGLQKCRHCLPCCVPRGSSPTPPALPGEQGAWPPPHWHGWVWGIFASQEDGTREAPVLSEGDNHIPSPQQAVIGVTAYVWGRTQIKLMRLQLLL